MVIMTQKVLQIGSSAGITISKEALKTLGLKIGDQVKVEVNERNKSVLVLPLRRSKVDAELLEWTDKMIDQYGPALRALAKK